MPKQTMAQALIEGLLTLGYTESLDKQGLKYRYFVHKNRPAIGPKGRPIYLIVGRNGALRRGTAISNSYVCTDAFRVEILDAQRQAKAKTTAVFADL